MNARAAIVRAVLVAATAALAPTQALAQRNNQGPPNALQGFSQNRNLPVKIQAATLEVRDKDKMATFSGDVRVTQGDTEMRSKSLVVYYEGDSMTGSVTGSVPADAGSPAKQQIRRIEAKGGVHVIQKDQTATGETGVFDMRNNTVTLVGNVVVTRGQDVLRGRRLVVDLTSGTSRIDAGGGATPGRVDMLIQPGQAGQNFGPATPARPARPN